MEKMTTTPWFTLADLIIEQKPFVSILFVLMAAWAFLLASGGLAMLRSCRRGSCITRERLVLAGSVLLGLLLSTVFSPEPPVVSTYTGFTHVVSSMNIASWRWKLTFPPGHPLGIQTLFALPIALGVHPLTAFAWGNRILFSSAIIALALVSRQVGASTRQSLMAAFFLAITPLGLLMAASDSLVIGYLALSLWTVWFALRLLQEPQNRFSMATFVASMTLLVQTRPDAVVMVAIIPLTIFVAPQGTLRKRAWVMFQAYLITGLFCLPAVSQILADLYAENSSTLTNTSPIIYSAIAVIVILILTSNRLLQNKSSYKIEATLSVLMIIFLSTQDISILAVSDISRAAGESASFLLTGIWLSETRMVSLLLLFFFLWFFVFRPRIPLSVRAFLILWMGSILVIASSRLTGELPFEGARTQIPALGPFLVGVSLVVPDFAQQRHPLVRSWGPWVVAGLVALTSLRGYGALAAFPFDQQREASFLEAVLPQLPKDAEVITADDCIERCQEPEHRNTLYTLFRTRLIPPALLGQVTDVPRFIRSGTTGPLPLKPTGNKFYYRGLNCWRSGTETMTPSCETAEKLYRMTEVSRQHIGIDRYSSDFMDEIQISNNEIDLIMFRIDGVAE